jgi:hypothetical protein
MIDLFIGLRFNRSVIISGSPLSGKSTIVKTILNVINEVLQSTDSNPTVESNINDDSSTQQNLKTIEFFKRYSLLALLLEDNKYLRVNLHRIYPNVYEQSQVI